MPRHPARSAPRRPGPSPARNQEPGSRDQILAAALAEFADRGFAGARVDRIAAAAGLNKAMLYYHFGNKDRLYRTTIEQLLGQLATRLEEVASTALPPAAKLDAYVETFITLGLTEPRLAPVMLREVAEGAARLDQGTVQIMMRIVGTMATIVREGRAAGVFRDVNPVLAYLTTVWPIMIYLASGPVRQVIHRHGNLDISGLEPASFIRHMQDVSRRSLLADPTGPAEVAPLPEHTS